MHSVRKTRAHQPQRDHWITLRAAGRVLGVSQVRVATMNTQREFGRNLHVGGHIYVDRRLVEAAKAAGRHLRRRDRELSDP